MGTAQKFKEFAAKGGMADLADLADLALGPWPLTLDAIVGSAFGKILTSLVDDFIAPFTGAIFVKLDFSNLFIALGQVPPGHGANARSDAEGWCAGAGLRQFYHRGDQLPCPGFHHFHHGENDEPAQARDTARLAPPAPAPAAAPPGDVAVLLREARNLRWLAQAICSLLRADSPLANTMAW